MTPMIATLFLSSFVSPSVSPVAPPRVTYVIEARLDPAGGTVEGKEILSFRNTTGLALRRLVLDWSPGGSRTLRVSVKGAAIDLLPGTSVSVFDLPQELRAGASLELATDFRTPFTLGNKDRAVKLTTWHPRLLWGMPSRDDYDVKLDVPAGYTLATSGRRDPQSGRWLGKGLRNFAVFLGEGYEVAEAIADDVLVRTVYTPKGKPCADFLRETAADVIRFYRQRFGFYPHSSLTILPGQLDPVGGYPVASAMVVVHGQEKFEGSSSHWSWITAHEIGHEYWSEYVLSNEPDALGWLMIGLGIWTDREYSQARGLADRHAARLQRCAESVRNGLDTTIDRTPDQVREVKFDWNNVVVHDKGFAVISALDAVGGDGSFDTLIRRCLRDYAGRTLGWREFQRTAEIHTGQSLNWFFDAWVRSNRYISYVLTSQSSERKGDRYETSVVVEAPGTLKMPVPVEVEFKDGTRQRAFTDRLLNRQELRFSSAVALRAARIDPDGELPLVVPPPKPGEAEVRRLVNDLPWSDAGGAAFDAYRKAVDAGLTGDTWFRLGLVLFDSGSYPESLESSRALLRNATDTLSRFGGLVWQGHLLDLLGRREEALQSYRWALLLAGNLRMQHDQWGMVIDRKWVEERLKTPFTRK